MSSGVMFCAPWSGHKSSLLRSTQLVNMETSTDVRSQMASTGGSVLITQRMPREMLSSHAHRLFGRCVDKPIACSRSLFECSVKALTLCYTAQVGELATERVLKIAKAAEAAKRLGQEAARAAGELELGAGDGVGANPHIPRLQLRRHALRYATSATTHHIAHAPLQRPNERWRQPQLQLR